MSFLPGLWRSSPTNCNVWWMRRPALTGTRKFDCGLTQLTHDNLHWLDVPERVKYKVIILTVDSSLPHQYRATVSSCRLCSCLQDGTETSSTHRRWSSARRAGIPSELMAFGRSLYSVRDYGTLCLDCCVTLATTLLALANLWRHSFSQYTSAYSALGALAIMLYTNLRLTYLLTYKNQCTK